MPRCGDLAIFVTTTDNRQTKPTALPLAYARGVIKDRDATIILLFCCFILNSDNFNVAVMLCHLRT